MPGCPTSSLVLEVDVLDARLLERLPPILEGHGRSVRVADQFQPHLPGGTGRRNHCEIAKQSRDSQYSNSAKIHKICLSEEM